MIFKIVGACVLAISGAFFGSFKTEELKNEYKESEDFYRLLSIIKEEMEAYGISVKEILLKNGIKKDLSKIHGGLSEELRKTSKSILSLGKGEILEEGRKIGEALEGVVLINERRKKKYTDAKGMYTTLGALLGTGIAIILM